MTWSAGSSTVAAAAAGETVTEEDRNPYRSWVQCFADALRAGALLHPAPGAAPRPAAPAAAPAALIFAPHPDDEVIVGGLPLRLLREQGFRVVDVAVTLGSRQDRRAGRWAELQAACAHLGFDLVTPDPAGIEHINPEGKQRHPRQWRTAVGRIAAILAAEQPRVVFLPHDDDWNQTHIGTHHLVVEAMRQVPNLACRVVETEFWGAMRSPNLMVESSAADVADLVAALALHVGEVARNPYHLRMPAWMIDNVRRGAELVGGQGGAAPDFAFATLYRLRDWAGGEWRPVLPQGVAVSAADDLGGLFPRG